MEQTFSQRAGIKPIREAFQIDSMDNALRNSLWNYCRTNVFIRRRYTGKRWELREDYSLLSEIWTKFLYQKYIDIDYTNARTFIEEYSGYFSEKEWYEVYDLLEFVMKKQNTNKSEQEIHISKINKILEREMSAYRFIGVQITQINAQAEIDSINEAQNNSIARAHIQTAIDLLSDRINPDYRNSIKESISAVEAICREITGASSLGNALKEIEKKALFEINGQFKKGLEQIYAYTNDGSTGIRHSLLNDSVEIECADAKFMLVICSAFVNYLTDRAK